VEAVDGELCGSKDARVIDVLEIMEVTENGHIEIRAFLQKKVAGSTAQPKCIYTNARSTGKKQNEVEATVQLENCYRIAVTDTWWDDPHNWSVSMDGYKLFRGDRQRRRGDGVTLGVAVCFGYVELDGGDERVECLWVGIRGKAK